MAESQLRLLSGQLRTAQEQERKYLSRELHDQVGQLLTGVRMELAGIARLHADPESELSTRITRAKGTVEQTLRVVRDIAMLLRPSMLDDLGLAPAIAWLLKETGRAGGFETRADIDPVADQLPEAHRTCVYRVFQEALTNASRHSGASTLEVSLKKAGDAILGTIADNGHGFERSPRTARGLGLLGMEERVKELGGSIRISSTRKGTTIDFRLPVPTHKESDDDQDSDSGRSRDRASRAEATP